MDTRQINDLFDGIALSASQTNDKLSAYLRSMKPEPHDHESSIWRLKLESFLYTLNSLEVVTDIFLDQTVDVIWGKEKNHNGKGRLGRDHHYNANITTANGRTFWFDVPAMNPNDAYHQLTKRIAYRTIPDISGVNIYEGKLKDREVDAVPMMEIGARDLVFVTLECLS